MERVSDGEVIPAGENLLIKSMSAYVAMDPTDNTEGIIAFEQNDTWRPMVGADQEMIESLRPIATRIARQQGIKVSLVRFSQREVVEEDILDEH